MVGGRTSAYVFVVLLCCLSCGTVASVRPLGQGRKAVSFSFGGPVTSVYDVDVPVPYSVIRLTYGLSKDTDLHFGVHPTMSLLANAGIDIGLSKHLTTESGLRPALCLGASLYGFCHINEFSSARVYPGISLIGSYAFFRSHNLLYFGAHALMQFTAPYVILAPLVGTEVPLGEKFAINAEALWYAPTEASKDRVVDYTLRPFDHGAAGFAAGVSYVF
ncbi:hypothetical protein AMJ87_06115 [candidate division WOR_3 bacterium SM23_60]|uniref:Outer membrane protein beta-barrel domain-containing protein n=1 Tax=candidate division WOR_3 bacterium SM23_60 TaxID=1703780 RepID=A0A0S8GIC0_UNCW3|nr:MAG: hypothetical protein AMJ87_06115 [candidate division WOR_3 bacterium SM23_60]